MGHVAAASWCRLKRREERLASSSRYSAVDGRPWQQMAYPSRQAATGHRAQAGAETLGLGAQVAAADTEHGQATAAGAQQKMSAGRAQHHQGRGLGARGLVERVALAAAGHRAEVVGQAAQVATQGLKAQVATQGLKAQATVGHRQALGLGHQTRVAEMEPMGLAGAEQWAPSQAGLAGAVRASAGRGAEAGPGWHLGLAERQRQTAGGATGHKG